MKKKKTALQKANSAIKKTEGAYTAKTIKQKLKRPLKGAKAGGKAIPKGLT